MSSTAAVILQQIQLLEETIRVLQENNQHEAVELKREELKLLHQRLQNANYALNENRSILKG